MTRHDCDKLERLGLRLHHEIETRLRRLEIVLAFLVGLNILQVGHQLVNWIKG